MYILKEDDIMKILSIIVLVLFFIISEPLEAKGKKRVIKEIDSTYFNLTDKDKLRFLDSLNKYRRGVGSPELEYSFKHDDLPIMRINTIVKHINKVTYIVCKENMRKHLHYRFKKDIKKYDVEKLPKDTSFLHGGECVYAFNELNYYKGKDLVEELFHSWKSSEDHWKSMLDPDYKFIVLGLQYKDGVIIGVLNSFQLQGIKK